MRYSESRGSNPEIRSTSSRGLLLIYISAEIDRSGDVGLAVSTWEEP
jgi:hypothetical protein